MTLLRGARAAPAGPATGGVRRARPSQAGFALPGAIILLLIVTLLTVAVITVSVQSSNSTTRDSGVKAELEAAEAGLQVARYRLNQLKPEASQCINEAKTVAANEKTWEKECKDGAEALGNGASFQYWVSLPLPLKVGEKCGGRPIETLKEKTQRCVTAEGKFSGVEQGVRLQVRVAASAAEPLFAVSGILGLEEILVNGSVKATAVTASNKKIVGEGSAAFEKGYEICPEGTFKPAAGKERTQSGVTVGGKKETPEVEKTRSAMECPIKAPLPASHATAENNEDSRIGKTDEFFTEGKAENKFTGAPNYELNLAANSKLTLGGSKYYFCKVQAESNGELKIASGAKVEIFIDSPEDPAGKCPAKSGTFKVEGNAKMKNPNGPAAMLIEMYGKGPFTLGNSGALTASLYAPEAEVTVSGAGELAGAIVGKKVHLEAGSFIWSSEDSSLTAGGSTASEYSRQVWEQCGSAGC